MSGSQQYEQHPSAGRQETRDAANRWLARFSPLLGNLDAATADEVRERLSLLPELRADGQRALAALEGEPRAADSAVLTTLRQAVRELDGLEQDFRRRLAALSPGDPEAAVDLDEIRQKLAEAAARREVEEVAGPTESRERELVLPTSYPNWGSALFMGIFSLGWNSFTTVHAVFLIGGFMHAFGPLALFLLGFYAIFWSVGIGMAIAAFMAGCKEELTLDQREITLRRRFLSIDWKRSFTLGASSRAYLTTPNVRAKGSMAQEIAIRDSQGKEVRFANGRSIEEQQSLLERINGYLKAV